MNIIQITEAQRAQIINSIGKKFEGTNARELQVREWKSNNGTRRIYINLMINGGSNASAWITETSTETTIDKGGEYYKAIAALEIKKWLGISLDAPIAAPVTLSASNPFARR